jgi:hypothetical protein
MDSTQSDELPKMIRVVEQYIQDTTGKKVRIVFNDVFNVRRHTQMLAQAYAYVLQKDGQKVK